MNANTKKTRLLRRLTAVMLTLVMMAGILPIQLQSLTALAADGFAPGDTELDNAQLDYLAQQLNNIPISFSQSGEQTLTGTSNPGIQPYGLGDPVLTLTNPAASLEVGERLKFRFMAELSDDLSGVGQLTVRRNSDNTAETLAPTITSDEYSQYVTYTYTVTEADLCLDDPNTTNDERSDNINVTLVSIAGANLNNTQNEPIDLSKAGYAHLSVSPVLGAVRADKAEYGSGESVTVTIPVSNGDIVSRSVSSGRLDQIYVSIDGTSYYCGTYNNTQQSVTAAIIPPANPGLTDVPYTVRVYTYYDYEHTYTEAGGNTVGFTVTGSGASLIAVTSMTIGGVPANNTVYLDGVPGDDGTLTVTILPDDATFMTYSWTSDNETVAQISPTGAITAYEPGVVTFTLTSDELVWRQGKGQTAGVDYDLAILQQTVTLTFRSPNTAFEASDVTVTLGNSPTVYWMWDGNYPEGCRDFKIKVYVGDTATGEPVWSGTKEITGIEAIWDPTTMSWGNWWFNPVASLSMSIPSEVISELGGSAYTYTVSTKNVNYPIIQDDVICEAHIAVNTPNPVIYWGSSKNNDECIFVAGTESTDVFCSYIFHELYQKEPGTDPEITVTVTKNSDDNTTVVYSSKDNFAGLKDVNFDNPSGSTKNYLATLSFNLPVSAPSGVTLYDTYSVKVTVANDPAIYKASKSRSFHVLGNYFSSVTLIDSEGDKMVMNTGNSSITLDNESKLGDKSSESLLTAYNQLNFYRNMRLDVDPAVTALGDAINYSPLKNVVAPGVVKDWHIYDNNAGGKEISSQNLTHFIAPLDIPQNADWTVRVNTPNKGSQVFRVVTKSLKDKAYFFSIGTPNSVVTIQYTSGDGNAVSRVLTSSANGRIAVYEVKGIASDVYIYSGDINSGGQNAGESVGYVAKADLVSGENSSGIGFNPALAGVDTSIASKLLSYPVNHVKMNNITVTRVYLKRLDGTPVDFDKVQVNAAIINRSNWNLTFGPYDIPANARGGVPVDADGQIAIQFPWDILQPITAANINTKMYDLMLEIVPPENSGDKPFLITISLDKFISGQLKGANVPVHFVTNEQVTHIQRAYSKTDQSLVSERNLTWADMNEYVIYEKNYDTYWQFIVRNDGNKPKQTPWIGSSANGSTDETWLDTRIYPDFDYNVSLKNDKQFDFLSQDYIVTQLYLNDFTSLYSHYSHYFVWEYTGSTYLGNMRAKRISPAYGIMSDEEQMKAQIADHAKVPQLDMQTVADDIDDPDMRTAFENFGIEIPTTLPFNFQFERSGNEYILRGVVSVNFIPGAGAMDAAIDLAQGFNDIFNTVVDEVYGAGRGDAHNESLTVSAMGLGNRAFVGIRGYVTGKGVYNPDTKSMEVSISDGGLVLEASGTYVHYMPFVFAEMEITVDGELSSTFSIRAPSASDLANSKSAVALDFWSEQKVAIGVKVRAGVGYSMLMVGGYVGVQGSAAASAEAANVVRGYLASGSARRSQSGSRINLSASLGIYARGILGPIMITWEKDLLKYNATALSPDNASNPYYGANVRMTAASRMALMGYALANETPLIDSVTDFANAQYSDDGEILVYTDVSGGKVLYSDDGGATFADIEPSGAPAYSFDLSGKGSFAVAAWETLPAGNILESNPNPGNLGAVLSQSDVRAGVYDGSGWTITSLTSNNNLADLSPKTAVNGSNAVAVWKQGSLGEMDLSASGAVPLDGALVYKRYSNKSKSWDNDEKIILPLTAESQVMNYDAAIASDGTILIVMSMSPQEGERAGAIKYAVIDTNGDVKLTDISVGGVNARVVYFDNGGADSKGFLIAYYSEDGGVSFFMTGAEGTAQGSPSQSYALGSDFEFAMVPAGSALEQFGLLWTDMDSQTGETVLYAVKFCGEDGSLSAPRLVCQTGERVAIASYDGYISGNTVTAAVNYAQIIFDTDGNVTGMEHQNGIKSSIGCFVTFQRTGKVNRLLMYRPLCN